MEDGTEQGKWPSVYWRPVNTRGHPETTPFNPRPASAAAIWSLGWFFFFFFNNRGNSGLKRLHSRSPTWQLAHSKAGVSVVVCATQQSTRCSVSHPTLTLACKRWIIPRSSRWALLWSFSAVTSHGPKVHRCGFSCTISVSCDIKWNDKNNSSQNELLLQRRFRKHQTPWETQTPFTLLHSPGGMRRSQTGCDVYLLTA